MLILSEAEEIVQLQFIPPLCYGDSHSMTHKIARSFGTHDGTFHADEVTACALLVLFDCVDKDKVYRTRDPLILAECEYVCDVGGLYDPHRKLFDHHQADYRGALSGAGMVLQYLKSVGKLTASEYTFINNSLVMGVDAHDNGKDPLIPGVATFSHIIANFTPVRYDCTPQDQDIAFHLAVDFCLGHLKRLLERFHYIHSCQTLVAECMKESKEVLVFDENIPWLDLFFELGGAAHPALFVIMPSGQHWKLRGIPPSLQEKMKVRHPLPQEWAGLLEEELKKVSHIPEAIFCHKGRFISVWATKEGALKALKQVLS